MMKLSVITINRNNAVGLRKTIESVVNQTFKDFEFIVVDGDSDDGSADVIRKYADKITFWVSEKDTGIYNAMNKGVRKAVGEYTLMLNSGDFFVDDKVLERIKDELDGTDIVQGNTVSCIEGKMVRNRGYGRSDISFLDVQRGFFLHQAAFCKRRLFDEFGYFDESYKYVSDTIFFVKTLGYGGASFKYVDVDVADFDSTGFSSSKNDKIRKEYHDEEMMMQHELFPGRLYDFCIDSEKKIALYDELHKHTLIWKTVMLLKIISKGFAK